MQAIDRTRLFREFDRIGKLAAQLFDDGFSAKQLVDVISRTDKRANGLGN